MHYVYILLSEREELYYGSTPDLRRRFQEHNEGRSKYTRGRTWQLVYYEAYLHRLDALRRERQLKTHGQAKAQTKRRMKLSIELASKDIKSKS